MKCAISFLLTGFLLFGSLQALAQSSTTQSGDEIRAFAEVMPEFVGGQEALSQFISDNVRYPEKEQRKGISGVVYVKFVVEKDGSISNVEVERGVKKGKGYDAEAVRLVKSMPRWNPGIQKGNKIRVQFVLPIRFTLT